MSSSAASIEPSIGRPGAFGAGDHDHRDTERPGRRDLGIGGAAAGVLRHQHVDVVLLQQCDLAGLVERTRRQDAGQVRHGERRIHGIDAAHHIGMLRGLFDKMGLLPADGEKHPAGRGTQCRDRLRRIRDHRPAVAVHRFPWRAGNREAADAGKPCGLGRIAGNSFCEGMGRVDQQVIGTGHEELRQFFGPAETAAAGRNRQRARIERAAGQRHQRLGIGTTCEAFGQKPPLGRAPENQDAVCVHG